MKSFLSAANKWSAVSRSRDVLKYTLKTANEKRRRREKKSQVEIARSESLECANMRSNNLNKYAITHFIMHIASVLSSISAILFLSLHQLQYGDAVLSFHFASYILHVAYLAFTFYFFSPSRLLHASLSRKQQRAKTRDLKEEGKKKMWLKLIQMINQKKSRLYDVMSAFG